MYLGFIINSKNMSLIEEKIQKKYDLCISAFVKSKPTIRFAAQAIGNEVANFPAVPLGPILYGALETDKIE